MLATAVASEAIRRVAASPLRGARYVQAQESRIITMWVVEPAKSPAKKKEEEGPEEERRRP